MAISKEQFNEMLVLPGHLTEEELTRSIMEAERMQMGVPEYLVAKGLITDENLGQTIANYFNVRFVNLKNVEIQDEHLSLIPEVVARAQRAIVFKVDETSISLATESLNNYEFIRLLGKKTGRQVQVYYATEKQISTALKRYKGDLHVVICELIERCTAGEEEGGVVLLVDRILEYANDSRASDVHIEPGEETVLIRFRIDGLLHEVLTYPLPLHEKVVFRIKIMSHLQTDEHQAAQDGRFEYYGRDNDFDVRVSVLPISYGENVVMRLLDSHSERYSLESLGLSENDYERVIAAIKKPHGMILAVGPTGSGKTTVLYTILEKLNEPEVNIMTIEDPVEYHISGIHQTQVNAKKDLTFATGLRSIVRQDPDIIMVGEIRDEETADIAVNSALTGHLVLSTLHTNDAATTFPRLIEMNVEPFLVASSVTIIIALRLVRRICPHCRKSYVPTRAEIETLELDEKALECIKCESGRMDPVQIRLYRGAGCKSCRGTGFMGRIGIFEILEVDQDIGFLITKKESADTINAMALTRGMNPLLHDGMRKALEGVTTLEEVIKVARS